MKRRQSLVARLQAIETNMVGWKVGEGGLREGPAGASNVEREKLLIGHFSRKYHTLQEFETEAREVFLNTELALEGVTYKV